MRYLVFLRAINVSGKNIIKMKEFKSQLENIGFKDVVTYIQSGNIALTSDETQVEEKITTLLKDIYNYNIEVLVFSENRYKKIVAKVKELSVNEDKKSYYFSLYKGKKPIITFDKNHKEDTIKIYDDFIFLNLVGGAGKTKFTNNFLEKKLGIIATSRNYNTMIKMLSFLDI